MKKIYNIQWQEVCNIEVIAENKSEAKDRWICKAYNKDEVSRNSLDEPDITTIGNII